MAGKPWYNNGIKEIQVGINEPVPDGFIRGRLPLTDQVLYNRKLSALNKSKEQKEKENRKRSETLKKTFANKSKEEKDLAIQKRKDTWNKKSEEEILLYRKKISDNTKGKNSGKVPWNKGLTKETDERVLKNAQHTSETNLKKIQQIKQEDPEYFNKWRSNINDVMRANNSFNKSDPEDRYYEKLVLEYSAKDVIRWYSDNRYPFSCDFYIPSKDLFIELNKHWTHGGHAYNKNSLSDISKLKEWQEKAKTSKFYRNAIYVWTDLDVRKLEFATKNKLNYKVIY